MVSNIITIPVEMADDVNTWVKENIDHEGGESTFLEGQDEDGNPTGTCSAGFPDDGSDYSEAMKAQFADYLMSYDPNSQPVEEAMTASINTMNNTMKSMKGTLLK